MRQSLAKKFLFIIHKGFLFLIIMLKGTSCPAKWNPFCHFDHQGIFSYCVLRSGCSFIMCSSDGPLSCSANQIIIYYPDPQSRSPFIAPLEADAHFSCSASQMLISRVPRGRCSLLHSANQKLTSQQRKTFIMLRRGGSLSIWQRRSLLCSVRQILCPQFREPALPPRENRPYILLHTHIVRDAIFHFFADRPRES